MANLRVKLENMEIRGVEEKEGKKTEDKVYDPFLVVRIDDEAGNRHELIDRDVENKGRYKRGTFCDIDAVLNYGYSNKGGGAWCRLEVKGIKEVK